MNEFVLKRGLKNIFAAEILTDDNSVDGGYVTGSPFHLIPAGEMTRTADNEKTDTYNEGERRNVYSNGACRGNDDNSSAR